MRLFNERLLFAMRVRGVKQIELAKAAGVSRAAATSWVKGDVQSISAESLIAISEALNVNPAWLATGAGSMDIQWPFKKIKPSDFNVLPSDVIADLEDIINLQIIKYRPQAEQKTS